MVQYAEKALYFAVGKTVIQGGCNVEKKERCSINAKTNNSPGIAIFTGEYNKNNQRCQTERSANSMGYTVGNFFAKGLGTVEWFFVVQIWDSLNFLWIISEHNRKMHYFNQMSPLIRDKRYMRY